MKPVEELLDDLDRAIDGLEPDVLDDRQGLRALAELRERAAWLRGWLT